MPPGEHEPITVAVAGAHGQIALRLCGVLAARGDHVRGLIRNPGHAGELRSAGAEPVVCDLETDDVVAVTRALGDAAVVVFAAGAGPGSGAERKLTMDRDGAIRLAQAAGDARYVMVSAVGAESPPDDDEVFSVYLRAKADADAAVMAGDAPWVILRPGPLDDSPGTGCVQLSTEPLREAVSRDDVALLLTLLIDGAGTSQVLYVGAGRTPIAAAVTGL